MSKKAKIVAVILVAVAVLLPLGVFLYCKQSGKTLKDLNPCKLFKKD